MLSVCQMVPFQYSMGETSRRSTRIMTEAMPEESIASPEIVKSLSGLMVEPSAGLVASPVGSVVSAVLPPRSSNSIQSSCAPASRPNTRSVCTPALRNSDMSTSLPLTRLLIRSSISWLLGGMCHSYWVPLSIWAKKEFWLLAGPLTPAFIWYSPAVAMETEYST